MRLRSLVLAIFAAVALLPSAVAADQPAITSMVPSSGDAAGGNLVVIYGAGFSSGATVRFGSTLSPNVQVAGSSAIVATVPAGTAGTTQAVVVTNPDGLSVTSPTPFVYNAAPIAGLTVSGLSPSSGAAAGGTIVTITGTGFVPGSVVYFGSTPGTNVSVADANTLTVVAPAGVLGSTVGVSVNAPNGYTAFVPAAYAFGSTTPSVSSSAQPTIAAVTPNTGTAAGGTQVTILGSGFAQGVAVAFGGVPATNVTIVNSTQLTVTTPSGTVGAVPVMVTNTNGAFGGLAGAFTYLVATPQLTAVAPSEGLLVGGSTITLTGSGFVNGATVTIGGQPARNVVVSSPTTITAVTPPGAPGAAVILVTNPGGIITGLATAFTYSATASVPAVSVTGVSPASGPLAGGTQVSITGTGFAAGATVTVGGVAATSVTVLSPTQLLATIPSSTVAGSTTVVVTVGGASNALFGGFTYTSGSSTGTTTPPVSSTSTGLAPGSSGLFVFRGGSNEELAAASGCSVTKVVLWATDAQGRWVAFIPAAPAVVNAAWRSMFPNGIPANTPIYVKCA